MNVDSPAPEKTPTSANVRRSLEGCALGALTVGLTTIPKVAFAETLGHPTPFLLYVLPVLLATLRGGWVAGTFTTCVSTAAGCMFQTVVADDAWPIVLRTVVFAAQALLFVFLIDRFSRERERARELVRDVSATRDRLNGILLGTADGITVHGTDGRCIFANDGAAQLLERGSASDVIGTSRNEVAADFELYDATHQPYDLRNSPSQIAFRTGKAAEDLFGFRLARRPEAPLRWSRVRANPILDRNGQVDSVVTLFYDVTETRRREEALALAQEWFQIALKSIADAVITTDEHGVVNMANRVAEVLLGKPATELHSRPIREVFQVFDESGREPTSDPVENVLRSGAGYQAPNPGQLRRSDGKIIPVDSSAAPIRDRDGNLRGVILVFRDVSAQRVRERQQALLTDVTEQLNSSFDYRVTLQAVARACVPLLGDWCAIDLQEGATLDRVVSAHANSDAALSEEVGKLGATHGTSDPHRKVLSDHFICIPLVKGTKFLGVLSLASSGPARKYSPDDHAVAASLADRIAVAVENARLFEATNAARERAIAADRTKSDFLAMLGHELRNPLAPIQTAVDVLRLNSAGRPEADEFRILERQLRHLVRLVDDLLDISRITRGRLELSHEVVDVEGIIVQARETVWPAGAPASHHVHVEATPDLRVSGDPIRLAQVLTNLFVNARKYSPQGSHIWVSAVERDGFVVVTMRDEGIGIGPEMLQKVFDTFVQEPQALDRSRGGLGLGLSIVQGLVAAHGGAVSAHSEGIGKGSTFEVRLPILGRTRSGASSPPRIVTRAAIECRILVVDDNVDAAEVMGTLLRKLGHTVFVANSPKEALDVAARERLDIALLDIGLPEMSGYELGRRLRESASRVALPLVAVTGYGQADDRERSKREGFAAHLVKPVALEELHQTLNTLACSAVTTTGTSAS